MRALCILGVALLALSPAASFFAASVRPAQPLLARGHPPLLRASRFKGPANATRGPGRAAASLRATTPTGGSISGIGAAGALASSALVAELVAYAGTAAALYWSKQHLGTESVAETVGVWIAYIQGLPGAAGYGVFAIALVFLQVVPVASAFFLMISAGAIFGVAEGTALVVACSTVSATIAFLLSRAVLRERVLEATQDSTQLVALDKAFASAGFATSLTLITLLRLSPVLPFTWANYIFGASPAPLAAFSLGTLLGCTPSVLAYVAAGSAGAELASTESPLLLGAVGVAATLGAVGFAGNIATAALKDLDVDLSE